jgi:hypothetical protein
MALLFCDSVRHYSTAARIAEKWTAASGTSPTVHSTGGRGNGPALRFLASGGNYNYFFRKVLSGNAATLIAGFRFTQIGAFSGTITPFVGFRDGGITQVSLAFTSSGNIVAYRGTPTTNLLGTSTNAILLSALDYIEFKATFHGTTGTVEVRVNGSSTGWLNLTGLNTQATANAYANEVIFGQAVGTGNERYFSDIVICDTSGSVNNDFLGEVNVDAYLPTGAGNYAQFTPSAGANWECVDEASPNTTDYVSSSTAGHIDTYAFADMIGNNPQIKGVVNNLWALKTDSGTVFAKSKYRRNDTDYTGANLTPGTTYTALQHVYETDPATGDPWVKGDFNDAEFGVEVSTS